MHVTSPQARSIPICHKAPTIRGNSEVAALAPGRLTSPGGRQKSQPSFIAQQGVNIVKFNTGETALSLWSRRQMAHVMQRTVVKGKDESTCHVRSAVSFEGRYKKRTWMRMDGSTQFAARLCARTRR